MARLDTCDDHAYGDLAAKLQLKTFLVELLNNEFYMTSSSNLLCAYLLISCGMFLHRLGHFIYRVVPIRCNCMLYTLLFVNIFLHLIL